MPNPSEPMLDPTQRFSDRVEHYDRYRPGYPDAILEPLRAAGLLTPGARVADVGSGTGKLAEVFLRAGCTVIGVEPNHAMRHAGDSALARFPRFSSVDARAEQTTLPDACVDLVCAGQAFHWFDPRAARHEFARILRPGGGAALVWNDRDTRRTEFMRIYESLLLELCPEYHQVGHKQYDESRLSEFFAPSAMQTAAFPYHQALDWDGVAGRLLSSSYVPKAGDAHDALMRRCRHAFERCARDGRVVFDYDTRVYFAPLARNEPAHVPVAAPADR